MGEIETKQQLEWTYNEAEDALELRRYEYYIPPGTGKLLQWLTLHPKDLVTLGEALKYASLTARKNGKPSGRPKGPTWCDL